MSKEELATMFEALRPWSQNPNFTDADWENYMRVAHVVQQTNSQVVEEALNLFMASGADPSSAEYTNESKLFLLMRVVFDLPEAAPVEVRRQGKGWTNWPPPDTHGEVSLSWPIFWRSGKPKLVASYEGSEGPPYPAVADYRHLLANYPFRNPGGA